MDKEDKKDPKEAYALAMKKQREQQQDKDATVKATFRYEDYILVLRGDGKKLKVALGSKISPFSVVMDGKLPDADKIETGVLS